MPELSAEKLCEYRDYLCMLGRAQLNEKIAAKVDVSGVVQVTLLEATQADWGGMDEPARMRWLRHALGNNLLDEIRKFRTQARDIAREVSLSQAIEKSASRWNLFVAADDSTPSRKAIRLEDEARLAQALALLPEPQREAIELHHIGGLKLEEIGERMGRSKGAVAALIFRGTTKLRQILASRGGDPDA